MPRIIYYWGLSGWVVKSSEIDCFLRFLLGRFHQTLEYWKIIHFSTFWHKFTFYVSFMSVLLFSIYSYFFICHNILRGLHISFFLFTVASGDCFYLWQILSCILMTTSVCFIFFILSQVACRVVYQPGKYSPLI